METHPDPLINAMFNSSWPLGPSRTITWAIADNPSYTWPYDAPGLIANALGKISDVANIHFQYVGRFSDVTTAPATMVYSVDASQNLFFPPGSGTIALAFFPLPSFVTSILPAYGLTRSIYPNPEGDIWFNAKHVKNFHEGGEGFTTLLHETGHALGLKHPHDSGGVGKPEFRDLGLSAYDDPIFEGADGVSVHTFTVMSYNDENFDVPGWGHPATMMPFDILALQALYGPNTTTNAGDTTHPVYADQIYRATWDANGRDTVDASGSSHPWIIALEVPTGNALLAPHLSHIGVALPSDDRLSLNWVFDAEDVRGSNQDDFILGNAGSNFLRGGAGDDTIGGGAGDDVIVGELGNDGIIGGAGNDIVAFGSSQGQYTILAAPDGRSAVGDNTRNEGVDILVEVERGWFAGAIVPMRASDSVLEYIASHSDLTRVFGVNAQAGFDHYVNWGYTEHRGVTFDGLEYCASYGDLMTVFGPRADLAAAHYITFGRAEGRKATFDGLEYIASYSDLSNVFGPNSDNGTAHYITNGRFEGRHILFDGLEYIASYRDLMNVFGSNSDAGAWHYITFGRTEGRRATFDGLEYIASYGDLINAFGINEDAGSSHYITYGRFEGRTTSFDGLRYIASYGDLIRAFGPNSDAGSSHFIMNGFREGRHTTFDPARYLANYADLRTVFGNDIEAATVHYIAHGYFEHRTDDFL